MTEQSANQVDALAVSRVGTDIVLRWRVRQDNGREFRVWFTRADTGVTYALNAVPLSSSTRMMTLDSQALAAPCGDFHLTQLLAGGTDTGPSMAVILPVGPGGCGGGGDPPPPPPDGIHWVTRWRHLDHLGSLRLLTDESGWVVSGSQVDYYPFGMPMDAAPPSSWLFTGHEKDAATGLDYMLARMHSASVGSFTSVDPADDRDRDAPHSFNKYAYVRNSPLSLLDPTGAYTGVDDAVFAAGGAVTGVIMQAVSDVVLNGGEFSSWENYAGAAAGGAAGGIALLYTGPVAAGAAAGAVGNLTTQGLKMATGKQESFSVTSLAVDTAVGAATGKIPGVNVTGITRGRNSYNAIFKQMQTKLKTGQVSRVRASTAVKMFTGRAVDTSLLPGTAVAAASQKADLATTVDDAVQEFLRSLDKIEDLEEVREIQGNETNAPGEKADGQEDQED